jgi:hypothetical protein
MKKFNLKRKKIVKGSKKFLGKELFLYEKLMELSNQVKEIDNKLNMLLSSGSGSKKHIKPEKPIESIVDLLNKEKYTVTIPNFNEWIKLIEFTNDDMECLIASNFIETVRNTLKRFLSYDKETIVINEYSRLSQQHHLPIRCFCEKKKIFYVFSNDQWKELSIDELVKVINGIYVKVTIRLSEYQSMYKSKMDYCDKKTNPCDKALIRLLRLKVTQDTTEFLKLRLFLYKFLC